MTIERSLRAPSEILNIASTVLKQKGYTPLKLAEEMGLSAELVEKFFRGESVDSHTFLSVCQRLGVNLRSPNHAPQPSPSVSPSTNLQVNPQSVTKLSSEQIVQEVRQSICESIQRQCDRLRVLGMAEPLKLRDIYTVPKFFVQIPSQRRLSIDELLKDESSGSFEGWRRQIPTTPALEIVQKHPKLAILGRLGAGKTVLLKYLALACSAGDFCPDLVPIFLSLREFTREFANSEFTGQPVSLAQYIAQQLANYGVEDRQLSEHLLRHGKLFLLCDELDDVSNLTRRSVIGQINQLADRFPQHQWAIASRSSNYTHLLEQFTTFELADFDVLQVYRFTTKWFQVSSTPSSSKNSDRSQNQSPNKFDQFTQFIDQKPLLKELASSPLVLSQICLAFQQATQLNEFGFYREVLDLLLQDWQAAKLDIPDGSPQLSEKKELLGHLAIAALDRHGYLWDRAQLEQEIQTFKRKGNLNQAIERSDWIEILKIQHGLIVEPAKGIFAFSDRALQASLVAHKIATSKNPVAIKYLWQHLGDRRWHDAIAIVVSMAKTPEELIRTIQNYAESLVANEQKIQRFLAWVSQQVLYLKSPFKPVAVKAFYLDFDLEKTRTLDRARALDIAHSRSLERAQMRSMGKDGEMQTTETGVDIDRAVTLALNLDLALYFVSYPILQLASALDPNLGKALAQLRQRLPDLGRDREKFARWWQNKGLEWSKQLREVIIQHRKGIQDWEFSEEQFALLRQYHDANKLLADCLNACPYIDPTVREKIESTLFASQLPSDDDLTILQG
ncbi:NACHT domain-containing protein [Tumidithrix elongata RA019]|uniref:NACHT domain-containing protein n=1 Tax=Tumidithrix elongata BACA0141 TaxID=2716417 RepID=A0AAW9PTH9_9CYAN|nr:NACHT domain-containing protein [Tumidithrix elongata RA019]